MMLLDNREMDNSTRQMLKSSAYQRSTLALIGIDSAAAVVLVAIIAYDAWRNRKSIAPRIGKSHVFGYYPAKTVPLSFAAATLIQCAIFMSVLAIYDPNRICRAKGHLVFPALWICGFVLLVFGIETMLRGFQEPAFGQRWRWSTVICWAVVALGLLLAWVPTRVREPGSDTCWAGILEYAFPWADLGLVVSFCLLISFVAVALGITFRMLRAHRLGAQERAEASQMVYYLVLGIVGYVFILPAWISASTNTRSKMASITATIALHLFSVPALPLYLVLRYRAARNRKYLQRLFGNEYHEKDPERPDTSMDQSFSKGGPPPSQGKSIPDTSADKSLPIPPPLLERHRRPNPPKYSLFPKPKAPKPLSQIFRNSIFSERTERSGSVKSKQEQQQQQQETQRNMGTLPSYDEALMYPFTPALFLGEELRGQTQSQSQSQENITTTSLHLYEDTSYLLPPTPAFAREENRSSEQSHWTVPIGLRLSNNTAAGQNYNSGGIQNNNLVVPMSPVSAVSLSQGSPLSLDVPLAISPVTSSIYPSMYGEPGNGYRSLTKQYM